MATSLGDLYVKLSAKTEGFGTKLSSASEAVEKVAKKVKAVGNDIGGVGLGLTAFAGGMLLAASKADKGVARQLEHITKSFTSLAVEISHAIMPAVVAFSDRLSALAHWFANLSPGVKGMISSFATFAVVGAGVAGAVGKISGVIGALAEGASVIGKLITAAGLPVAGVVAAVLGLVVAAAYLNKAWKQNWGGIQEKTRGVLKWMSDKFGGFGSFVGKVFGQIRDTFFGLLRKLVEGAKKVSEFLGLDLGSVFELEGDLINWGENLFTAQGMANLFDDAVETGKMVGKGIAAGIQDVGSTVGDLAKDLGLNGLLTMGSGGRHAASGEAGATKGEGTYYGPMSSTPTPGTEALAPMLNSWETFNVAAAGWTQAGLEGLYASEIAFREMCEADIKASEERAAQVKENAISSMQNKALNSTGPIGGAVSAGMEGMAAGGPWGALLGVVMEVLASSTQFQTILEMVSNIFQMVADTFGVVFEPVQLILGALMTIIEPALAALKPALAMICDVLEMLAPPLVMVGTLMTALGPVIDLITQAVMTFLLIPFKLLGGALKLFFPVIGTLAAGFLWVVMGIGKVWNGIVSAIQTVFQKLGSISIFGKKPLGFMLDWSASLDKAKVPLDKLAEAQRSLKDLTWEQAEAKAKETAATIKQTEATKQATEAMTNVPSAYRVALARYSAQTPDAGPMPTSGGQASAPSSGVVTSLPVAGSAPVVVNVIGVTEPRAVAAAVVRSQQQENLRRTGALRMRAEYKVSGGR